MNFHLQRAEKKAKVWTNRSSRASNVFIDFPVKQNNSKKNNNYWKKKKTPWRKMRLLWERMMNAPLLRLAARLTCRLHTDILIFHPKFKGGASWARLFLPNNKLSRPEMKQHIQPCVCRLLLYLSRVCGSGKKTTTKKQGGAKTRL